jgi:hypothetical protein
MPDQAPLVKTFKANTPAFALTVDGHAGVCEAPFDGTVTGVSYVPEAAVTGANTDSRTLTLVNKGQAGADSTVVATLAFTVGVNGVAYDEKAFTLSAVAGATTVVAGDIIEFVSTHLGSTGLADPGGLVQVDITRS